MKIKTFLLGVLVICLLCGGTLAESYGIALITAGGNGKVHLL